MEKIKCIICNSDNSEYFLSVKDRFNKNDLYNLVRCFCGLIYLNPRPTELEINKFYQNINYDPHNNENSSIFSMLYNVIKKYAFNRKLKLIKKYYNKSGKHIDIGGGIGEFCDFMKKQKWLSINQDTSIKALDISNSKNIQSINKIDNSIKTESIDLITSWHSIEHIHNLNNYMLEIKRILKSKKYFFMCVPNSEAIEQKYYKEKWVAWDAPRHLYHFTPELLKKYVEKYNFKVVYCESIFQDTAYNILLSIDKKNIIRYIEGFLVLIFSYLVNIVLGYKKSSSFILICKKK